MRSSVSKFYIKKYVEYWWKLILIFIILWICSNFECLIEKHFCQKFFLWVDVCTHHKPYHLENSPFLVRLIDVSGISFFFKFLYSFFYFSLNGVLTLSWMSRTHFWHKLIFCRWKFVDYYDHFYIFRKIYHPKMTSWLEAFWFLVGSTIRLPLVFYKSWFFAIHTAQFAKRIMYSISVFEGLGFLLSVFFFIQEKW